MNYAERCYIFFGGFLKTINVHGKYSNTELAINNNNNDACTITATLLLAVRIGETVREVQVACGLYILQAFFHLSLFVKESYFRDDFNW
jgi:hypothetical protein